MFSAKTGSPDPLKQDSGVVGGNDLTQNHTVTRLPSSLVPVNSVLPFSINLSGDEPVLIYGDSTEVELIACTSGRQKGRTKRVVSTKTQPENIISTTISISKSMSFIGFTSTSVNGYVWSPGANVTFELSDCTEINSFSALYDEYRIMYVDVCFTYIPKGGSTYSNDQAVLYYAPDRDGGTVPGNYSAQLELQQTAMVPLKFFQPSTTWFTKQQTGYNDNGKIISGTRWHDCADLDITFCVGVCSMLKRTSTVSGVSEYMPLLIKPHIQFRRRR